jgi:hypothetical protein
MMRLTSHLPLLFTACCALGTGCSSQPEMHGADLCYACGYRHSTLHTVLQTVAFCWGMFIGLLAQVP